VPLKRRPAPWFSLYGILPFYVCSWSSSSFLTRRISFPFFLPFGTRGSPASGFDLFGHSLEWMLHFPVRTNPLPWSCSPRSNFRFLSLGDRPYLRFPPGVFCYDLQSKLISAVTSDTSMVALSPSQALKPGPARPPPTPSANFFFSLVRRRYRLSWLVLRIQSCCS